MRSLTKRFSKKLLSLILLSVLVADFSWLAMNIQPALASPGLTLKWKKYIGLDTHLAPLAADLYGDGKLEIVMDGLYHNNSKLGAVAVLNGTNGNVVWQVNNPSIGTHSPFDIVDLNKDGIPEIVVSAWYPTVYFGNNGSLYWMNTVARAFQNYNAIADIDGDGYPEIFISSGSGPSAGADYIYEMSYDGNVLHQAFTWHPCFGGSTIGDTNFDGIFELYSCDRKVQTDSETYKGGGGGLRALDARTLQPLWNDPSIAMSSHAPMLADVDNDGILDVLVMLQSSRGLAVLRSSDGSVLTTGGKYRKGVTDMNSHSQPTIYDIDGDGHLELINAGDGGTGGTQIKIWDLYDWKLDADSSTNSFIYMPGSVPSGKSTIAVVEPPRVGDVTGDGKMDIIAPTDHEIHIFSYINGKYTEVDRVMSGLAWGTNSFTLLQDVDGNGLNELILTSMSGYVYAYDTPAPAPTPRARSNLQFYSEYKLGVQNMCLRLRHLNQL